MIFFSVSGFFSLKSYLFFSILMSHGISTGTTIIIIVVVLFLLLGVMLFTHSPHSKWCRKIFLILPRDVFQPVRISITYTYEDKVMVSSSAALGEIVQILDFCPESISIMISVVSSSCIIIIIIIYSFRVFHISISYWFFPGISVTGSLLKSQGLFSGFWP